jgi:ferrous iron transport protein B
MENKEETTIALIGNPNSGKSAVFNLLTGARQTLGNWPGVTVEKKEGYYNFNGKKIKVIDLPGSYSLKPQSEDEVIACNYILSGEADFYVNILDATNLERNMYLSMQIIEMQKPVLFVINMIDIAEKHGIVIDAENLNRKFHKDFIDGRHIAEHLGSNVVAVSAVKKESEAVLKKAIDSALAKPVIPPPAVTYPDEIEEVLCRWEPQLTLTAQKFAVSPRYIAVKILENDPAVTTEAILLNEITDDAIDTAKYHIRDILGSNPATAIAESRYAAVRGIAEETISVKTARDKNFTNTIDRVVLNRYAGIPIFLGIMFLIFWFVQKFGGAFIDFFDILGGTLFVDGPKQLFDSLGMPYLLNAFITDGIGGGLQTVATFIPPIFAIFFCLSILEDSGYMARAAFIMDRFMRLIGLPGKSFVPLIVGFGCTAPAIMGTRALESRRDRILTIFMAPMMSCGARLPVLVLFGTAFFGSHSGLMVFSIYLLGIVIAIATGFLINKTLVKSKPSHFIMELPPYHVPHLKHVLKHSWNRLKAFIFKAGKFIVIAMVVLGLLNSINLKGHAVENESESVLSYIGKGVTPIFEPFGVEKENWPASVALFTGLFAKEAIIGTLSALYSLNAAADEESPEEEEPFSLSAGILEALATIPANLSDAFTNPGELVSSDSGEEESTEIMLYQNMRSSFTQGKWQAYAYLIFVLLYVPCMAAMGTALRELGKFYWALLIVYLTITAWSLATLFYQIVLGKSLFWIIFALALLVLTIIIFNIIGKKTEHKIDTLNVSAKNYCGGGCSDKDNCCH